MSHKIFQTQKGVNFTFPKTYPYMSLSKDINDLAESAVCKIFHRTPRFKAPANTVYYRSKSYFYSLAHESSSNRTENLDLKNSFLDLSKINLHESIINLTKLKVLMGPVTSSNLMIFKGGQIDFSVY